MFSGLSDVQVKELQARYGKNAIPEPKYRFLRLFARQFKGIFNLLLIAAALITLFLGEPIDAAFITLFVILSVGLSLYQEYKSNAAADMLRSYLCRQITVRRNNKDVEVSVEDLVPGDILKLESGDIVPADAIVRQTLGLQVDETTFTGESVPVVKIASSSNDPEDESMLLQGVVIVRGSAYAEVIKTGTATRLAGIAKTTTTISSVSELTRGVDRISSFTVKMASITIMFVIAGNVLIEGASVDLPHLLIFCIALAISVIPEALPLVITFSLSRGALRLAKKHVIVKRLSSVQDLGSVEILCSDKTGTLTENRLVYKNCYTVPASKFHPLVLSRFAAHGLDEAHPEPFDRATDEALSDADRELALSYQVIEEEAFEPSLRSNGAVVKKGSERIHVRRGSPEYFIGEGLITKESVASWLEEEEEEGHRVLGVSYDDGTGAVFGGFVSFADTLKQTTKDTIAAAQKLNVALTIITGDSVRVAEAVGRETGLVCDESEVVEAATFLKLPVRTQRERAKSIRVFARTTPEQKLELIELLKETATVGFLGEGINDAPALKAAHVSMVVQSASDVARETADIVLLESDLRVIVDGIRLGRETHANTLKYIRTTLISNFGNFYSVSIGSLFITFLPMLPKQILLLNLLSDFPMMAIAYDKVGEEEVRQPQRYDFRSLYIIFMTLGLVSTVFDFMWFGLFYRISPEVLQTNWFVASVITEILLIFSIRSLLPIEKAGFPARSITILSAGAFITALLIPSIPATAHFFHFTPPSAAHMALIVSLSFVYLLTTELLKRPLMRFLQSHKLSTT